MHAGRADRVTERDHPTVGVHLVGIEAEHLGDRAACAANASFSSITSMSPSVRPALLQRARDRRDRALRPCSRARRRHGPRRRSSPAASSPRAATSRRGDQDDGGRAVVDAAGIAGGHRPAILEGRPHPGEAGGSRCPPAGARRCRTGGALAGPDLDWNDLLRETAFSNRAGRAAMAGQGKLVLSSRLISWRSATFSAVMPMWKSPMASCSPTTSASSWVLAPILRPQRTP